MPLRSAASNCVVGPGADAGVAVGRDVRRDDDAERRLDRRGRRRMSCRCPGRCGSRRSRPRWRDSGRCSICVKSCGSDSPRRRPTPQPNSSAAQRRAAIDGGARYASTSGPGFFRYWLRIAVGRPERQRRDRAGRVVAGVLRERARAQHEQVRHVPALQIAVERAGLRIGAHDGAAVEMRGLVGGDVVGALARASCRPVRAHRLDDLGVLVGQKAAALSSLSWKSMVMRISGRPKRSL